MKTSLLPVALCIAIAFPAAAAEVSPVRDHTQTDVATARRLLQDLARRLEDRYPSAAASVREGLEEPLTVLTLGLSDRLRQSLATMNAIEA